VAPAATFYASGTCYLQHGAPPPFTPMTTFYVGRRPSTQVANAAGGGPSEESTEAPTRGCFSGAGAFHGGDHVPGGAAPNSRRRGAVLGGASMYPMTQPEYMVSRSQIW
jgi:hypothetical protein